MEAMGKPLWKIEQAPDANTEVGLALLAVLLALSFLFITILTIELWLLLRKLNGLQKKYMMK